MYQRLVYVYSIVSLYYNEIIASVLTVILKCMFNISTELRGKDQKRHWANIQIHHIMNFLMTSQQLNHQFFIFNIQHSLCACSYWHTLAGVIVQPSVENVFNTPVRWGLVEWGGYFKRWAPPQDVWHVSVGPQATGWLIAQACGGLFVCTKLPWLPIPLHLFPINRGESIKQGADRGWEQSSSCLDHGVYCLAERAVPAGEPALTRPWLLRSSTRRAVCQQRDRRWTGKRCTSDGCGS